MNKKLITAIIKNRHNPSGKCSLIFNNHFPFTTELQLFQCNDDESTAIIVNQDSFFPQKRVADDAEQHVKCMFCAYMKQSYIGLREISGNMGVFYVIKLLLKMIF